MADREYHAVRLVRAGVAWDWCLKCAGFPWLSLDLACDDDAAPWDEDGEERVVRVVGGLA